jgi:putative SOS response-associated peptidase YedK
MCGRYFRRSDKQEIAERFRAGKVFADPLVEDYNIAPSTFQPVIRLATDTGERELALLRWGLIPSFASSLREFKQISTFNARAESLTTSATWRESFKRRRCLIPADGFYEWSERPASPSLGALHVSASPPAPSRQRAARKVRQPYAVSLPGGAMMAIAGLWDAWKEPKRSPQEVDRWLQSFALITTEANAAMAAIHSRMPLILPEKDWEQWLDRDPSQPTPLHLLRSAAPPELCIQPCSSALGNVRNHGPELLVLN